MYHLRFCLSISLLAAITGLWPAYADVTSPTHVTVQQVIAYAVQNAEQVQIAEARQKAAAARTSAAWRQLGPTASLTGSWTHRTQAASRLGQQKDSLAASGEIAVDLWDPSAAPLLRAARYLEKAQNLSTDIAKRDVAFAAAEAYLSASVAQLELRAAQERLTTSTQAVSEAESRYRAGIIAEDIMLQFELDRARAEAYHSTARTALRRALAVLQLLTHRPLAATQIAPAVTEPETDYGEFEPPVASALRPEVAAYNARIGATLATSREPRLRILPSLSASARYNTSTELSLLDIEPYWTLQAMARWSLWDGGVRYAESRAARAEVEALELERGSYLRQLESDTALARTEISDADTDLAAARKRLALAKRREQSVNAKFRAGLASALERSDAYAAALEADAALAAAAARSAAARNNYAQLTGKWPHGLSPQQLEHKPP